MAKNKLNGSAERFALALRDMVREAVREEVEPLKADIAELKKDMDERFTRVDEDIRQLRGDMESGFTELRPPK